MSCSQSILSLQDLSKEEILHILDLTAKEEGASDTPLKGRIMASCFFEPSTRTRLSFESAMKQLGGDVIGFSEGKNSSLSKGESLFDTVKVISAYADLIVLRSPFEGSARLAAQAASCPVINAGDGKNQHPTQTLTDLYTIRQTQGTLEGLKIAFSGDLKNGRAVRSLLLAASLFQMRLYFVPIPGLEPSARLLDSLKQKGTLFSFHSTLEEILPKLDILYMTRIQEERMHACPPIKPAWTLKPEMLRGVKDHFKVLHPLPRVNEISKECDALPYAHYFRQAENGLIVRKALLRRGIAHVNSSTG